MVGQTDLQSEQIYGQILAKYFDDANTIFVVSSDFCHWGERFDYQYYNKQDGAIWQSIEALDKKGAALIESQNPVAFNKYLEDTQNTICGRHPIGILLQVIAQSTLKSQIKTKVVKYAQSGKVVDQDDSSVSYCSMITYI